MKPIFERRKFGRRGSSAQGWICVGGRPRLSCLVRNISPQGALLECERPRWLPYEFMLIVEGSRERHVCEIRHALTTGVGVVFKARLSDEQTLRVARSLVVESDDWIGFGSNFLPRFGRKSGRKWC